MTALRVFGILASSKSTEGCVHKVAVDGINGRPVCGWKYPERAHVRLSFDHALSLPSAQRCEVCWPSSSINNHSNSSGSETSSGTSDEDQ